MLSVHEGVLNFCHLNTDVHLKFYDNIFKNVFGVYMPLVIHVSTVMINLFASGT